MIRYSGAQLIRTCTKGHAKVCMIRLSVLSGLSEKALPQATSCMLRHGSTCGLAPREDKAVFVLQPCILILKVGKIFRKVPFRGVELI